LEQNGKPLGELPIMSIENPTLVHFRHFSSLFTKLPSTLVENPLQIDLFMQNKPNLLNVQMNVNKVLTKNYENKTLGRRGKNKANQSQYKPNQSQYNANQSQYKPKTNPIKPNFKGKKSSWSGNDKRRLTAVLIRPTMLPNRFGNGLF